MEPRLQYLFRRYVDNTCTQEEMEEFLGYVQQSNQDESLRQLIRHLYDELKDDAVAVPHVDENGQLVLGNNKDVTVSHIPENVPSLPVKRKHRIRTASYAIAASVIMIICTVLIAPLVMKAPARQQTTAELTKRSTNRSESKFILLEDSTQVWLNAATSLDFPERFNAVTREVYLTGEAYFDVKHADKVPFVIHLGDISVTVLGTAFNIKAYPGQKNITIAVTRGKVKVTRKDGWEVTLVKDQQVKLNENSQETSGKNISGELISGWQHGNIYYDDEPLKDIISDMERVYNVHVNIENQTIADQEISTSFKKDIGIEHALMVLCRLTDTELKKTSEGYIIK
jgi:ferric-dicitrate binding protein FerR (iron transport regulator)